MGGLSGSPFLLPELLSSFPLFPYTYFYALLLTFHFQLFPLTMTALSELLDYIFDSKKTAFYSEFESWVKNSRRFKAFAIDYRSKIRTKLKNVRDEAGMKDLRAELQSAVLLLQEASFALEYERYAALKQRGPDYTVIFKTHTPFNIEIRRIRSIEFDEDSEARITKLMAVLCDKVGQMPASIVNLLWLTAEREIPEAELNQAALTLRQLADRKVEEFFTKRGFKNAADFLKQYRQLSGIILQQNGKTILWQNVIAQHKTPPDIVRAIQRIV
jgi:hypothetical protein